MKLSQITLNERPQERLQALGPSALSDAELMAMLLRSGNKEFDVLAIARKLVTEAGSLSGLLTWSAADFQRVKGIGKVKSLQLITVIEIARRILSQEESKPKPMDSPAKVYNYFLPIASGLTVEKFWVLCLNRKNHVIRHIEVTSGTLTASLVHPREVFKEAIRLSASAIIAVHNHPSGDPSPSNADTAVTRQLLQAGQILNIPVLDHIILGSPNTAPLHKPFFSFSEHNQLK
ncbi:MAG: hypothetical protein COZ46_05330 [Verrucomicrobia bacterium CG_4_10_14_3_um_filter_43_23]|nr:MAG: hypothetical protein AUJ82_08220 [Verrucomicrobia bacterium CG1_02_43_26]PIP59944.1 MAG: hypothetical protein COX01_00940 [Verrucomicrobia bacterium CG22_combo_CG10-13_8_21_14_all_43_17]PIX58146.1 MAG: hypothetical protein COZ46_05330 [Verrucomicrobia bacterium CG_4_10_14_3_um_filter_43_23]PIY61855.1 MAG: hypothetical protein COY94_03375 [Verrucomicrobia bacterium CG_4_10_14_0_8_um_filter_43_34]PJA44476.1 MAG: hypothetical protein CO175_02840 [Verrucomicrobia bacterium CG_4_9_14_3_um_fi